MIFNENGQVLNEGLFSKIKEKIKNNKQNTAKNEKEQPIFSDVKVCGDSVEITGVTQEEYDNNKSIYNNFLNKVNSSSKTILKDIKKTILKANLGSYYDDVVKSTDCSMEFHTLSIYPDSFSLFGSVSDGENSIEITIYQNASGKIDWDYDV